MLRRRPVPQNPTLPYKQRILFANGVRPGQEENSDTNRNALETKIAYPGYSNELEAWTYTPTALSKAVLRAPPSSSILRKSEPRNPEASKLPSHLTTESLFDSVRPVSYNPKSGKFQISLRNGQQIEGIDATELRSKLFTYRQTQRKKPGIRPPPTPTLHNNVFTGDNRKDILTGVAWERGAPTRALIDGRPDINNLEALMNYPYLLEQKASQNEASAYRIFSKPEIISNILATDKNSPQRQLINKMLKKYPNLEQQLRDETFINKTSWSKEHLEMPPKRSIFGPYNLFGGTRKSKRRAPKTKRRHR